MLSWLYTCILLKTNGKYADQAGWKKAHSGQYLCCSHATTSFLLMTKILCVAGRRVPFDDYPIISVLVYADTIKASLYFQLK